MALLRWLGERLRGRRRWEEARDGYHQLVEPEVRLIRVPYYREHQPNSPAGKRLGCPLCAPSCAPPSSPGPVIGPSESSAASPEEIRRRLERNSTTGSIGPL